MEMPMRPKQPLKPWVKTPSKTEIIFIYPYCKVGGKEPDKVYFDIYQEMPNNSHIVKSISYSSLVKFIELYDVEINDIIIADISDHAFIRHQNQRKMYTEPVPAPIARRNFHAPAIVSICDVTNPDKITNTTVEIRATVT